MNQLELDLINLRRKMQHHIDSLRGRNLKLRELLEPYINELDLIISKLQDAELHKGDLHR